MDTGEVLGWIDEAYALLGTKSVGFSGGEPFLYLNQLKSIMLYCSSKYRMASDVATNAFWAVSSETTEAVLADLYDLGLRQLLISVDDYHQEWIPLERVSTCLNVAMRLGIRCTLQCVVTLHSNNLNHYLEALGVSEGPRLQAAEIPCTPIGYAQTALPASEFPVVPGVPSDYCSMLSGPIIHPDGTVYMCCGPTFTADALAAGNIRQESLQDIIERAEWNPIYNALILGNGPALLAEALASHGQDKFLLRGYATSCHACNDILGTEGVVSLLREFLEDDRPRLFLKRNMLMQYLDSGKDDPWTAEHDDAVI